MGTELAPIVVEGRNCWRIERAEKARMIVDAADYYALLERLMADAKQRILLIGWDFDPRIALKPGKDGKGEPLGDYLLRLAKEKPDRDIDILRWNFGALKQFAMPRILSMVARWKLTRSISFRLDSAHPVGCSHHQKVAVFDDHLAVCGGIDVGSRRWDTRDHKDGDPHRTAPDGKAYMPWHDSTMILAGPVGNALADLGNERWQRATKKPLRDLTGKGENWPDDLEPDFEGVDVAISRTRAEYDGYGEIREIEQLYLDMIAAAKHFIYFENQYFTCAKIAAAIAERLDEDDAPEFVMVMPETADGWLEQMAMDAARVQLVREIAKAKHGDRLKVYFPRTAKGDPIYVHAKTAVIDDRMIRVGSANMNNRSMGLDSECDVTIDAALPANAGAGPAIRRLRESLIAEHLDVDPAEVGSRFDATGSLIATIEALRGSGRSLELLDLTKPGPFDEFIAENELLDPTSPDDMFESLTERGLRKSWHRGKSWMKRHRPFRRKA
ncbi:phospholipase D-like domain-containing protein [Sphingopyxis sp. SE2]|uniref:phospholipase D-like domain-containing protein n=1 Tax=unclassified Sphingopyxis TaxID=2614943 RepID=UPI00050F3048|nr:MULTISPECIES: phospholipase D-like domain-containing protein [unclassified Sphingopyxis]KGB57271.1 Phospholipase D/transphosphatidylase [Sphingopyxis sp. LC363]MDT7527947.1 phospholipase D-like domain-containing protein [Sphingopyxis sp. SE2]